MLPTEYYEQVLEAIFVLQKENKTFLKLCYTWDLNLQYSNQGSMERSRVAIPGGDLLDDPLTPCAGTQRTIVFRQLVLVFLFRA